MVNRMTDINPDGLYRLKKQVNLIWNVEDWAQDNEIEAYYNDAKNIIEEVLNWCGFNMGYKQLGAFSILEVGNIALNWVDEIVSNDIFVNEFVYELDLFAFLICSYYGIDYKELCFQNGHVSIVSYDSCMVCNNEQWESEEDCYKASLRMIEEHRSEYELRMMDELTQYTSRKKVVKRESNIKYKKYNVYTDVKKYDTSSKEFNEDIKQRILNSDSFVEYKYDLKFLCSHQKAGCLLAEKYSRFAFFYDTGTGKTIMSLSIMYEKYRKEKVSFLILAPLAIIENAWLEDAYNYFPGMKILPLCSRYKQQDYRDIYDQWRSSGTIPKQFIISSYEWESYFKSSDFRNTVAFTKMIALADHYIVNIEMYRRNPEEYLLNKIKGLIIDESALLKNPHTTSSKIVSEYANEYSYIYLLSGKPAPNNSFEYYMQMRLVDPDNFDMSPEDFRQTFFVSGRDGLVFKNEEYEAIAAAMISQRSLIVNKEDCLKLKEQNEVVIPVKLDEYTMMKYKQVMNGCFDRLRETESEFDSRRRKFLATSKRLAVVTKLREVTSGFIIDSYNTCQRIHDKKEKALLNLILKYPGEQFVVWCNFIYEIERIRDILSRYGIVVDAYSKTKNLQKNIRNFKQKKARFLIAHPKTLKYGVTLVNCQRAVYYSLSYSAEDYYQSHDRIYRMGQEKDCYFYFFLAEDTIDETIFECVKNKMGYADMFQQIVKHAAEHGVKYNDSICASTNSREINIQETDRIKKDYAFCLSGDSSFAYVYDGEERNSILRNTILSTYSNLYPEEMLFEIGYDVWLGEFGNVTVRQIERLSEWVKSKLQESRIEVNKRVLDYLDEQEDKQRQQDIARGIIFNYSNME